LDHPEGVKETARKTAEKRLLEVFNLSAADKQKIVEFQGNVCAICKGPMNLKNVDHDHQTGQIRGILCYLCNRALGTFLDSVVRLRAALEYMTNFPATAALGAPRFGLPGRTNTKKQRKLILQNRKNRKLCEYFPQESP
jgi:hypothetical protein